MKNKHKPKGKMYEVYMTMVLIVALLLFLTMKYSLCKKESLREPVVEPKIEPILRQESDFYLKSSYPAFTIENHVLGSLMGDARETKSSQLTMNDELNRLIMCESSGNIYAENLKDIHKWKDGTISVGSYGILQFGKPTFQEFCVERYGLRDDLFDPEIQIRCAEKMISEGYEYRWGCWDIIHNK